MAHELKKDIKYRADIDSLRALSVLLVMLFHFKVAGFGGGFLGVDIFFVISGYLITGQIFDEYVNTNNFSFKKFYFRRARRLLPAFFVTLVLCTIIAFILFSPSHLQRYGESIKYALFSYSNFYLWSEGGYFDITSSLKPLLHTWSLSVEEQFYLFWPLLIWGVAKIWGYRKILFVIFFLGVISFVISVFVESDFFNHIAPNIEQVLPIVKNKKDFLFYFTPFRVYEFSVGALARLVKFDIKPDRAINRLVKSMSLVVTLLIILMTTEISDHQNIRTFFLCIATGLYLKFDVKTFITSTNFLAYMGKLSYSIYLVHWPIYVFYSYYTNKDVNGLEVTVLVALSVSIAYLLYNYIEEPFRRKTIYPVFRTVEFAHLGIFLLLMMQFGNYFAKDGVISRIDSVASATEKQLKSDEDRYCDVLLDEESSELFTCIHDREKEKTIFLWGDSHARHLIAGLASEFPEYNIKIAYYSGCPVQSGFSDYIYPYPSEEHRQRHCIERNARFIQNLKYVHEKDIILISQYINTDSLEDKKFLNSTAKIVKVLKSHRKKFYILSDVVRPSVYLHDCISMPRWFSKRLIGERCKFDVITAQRIVEAAKSLKSMMPNEFIDASRAFLLADGTYGKYMTDEGYPIFRDKSHLTIKGSEYYIGEISRMGLLQIPDELNAY